MDIVSKEFITTEFEIGKDKHPIHANPGAFLLFDNAGALTIALKPEYQGEKRHGAELDIMNYCKKRNIMIKLYIENATTNTHYHGWFCYPNRKIRKNFQLFVNKYGKFFESKMDDDTDRNGWVRYCTKGLLHFTENIKDHFRNKNCFELPPPPKVEECNMTYEEYYKEEFGEPIYIEM